VVLFARLCTFVQGIEKNWVTREKRSCKRAVAPVYCTYPTSPEAEASAQGRRVEVEQRMKQVVQAVVVAAALAASSAWGISVDPAISYTTITGTSLSYRTVGIPFYVNTQITVVSLGAFDYAGDGLSAGTTINVGIYNWLGFPYVPAGSALVSATLNQSSPAVSGTGSVWSYVGTPVNLTPGWYMILASGFTSNDPAITGMSGTDYSVNTFGGAVSYGYSLSSTTPTLYGILVYNDSSNPQWIFSNSAAIQTFGGTFGVPEPSTYALMGTVGLVLYLLRRRKKAAER